MALRMTLLVLALLSLAPFVHTQVRPDLGADKPLKWGRPDAKFQIESLN